MSAQPKGQNTDDDEANAALPIAGTVDEFFERFLREDGQDYPPIDPPKDNRLKDRVLDDREILLNRIFTNLCTLPVGELLRVDNTVEKKKLNWEGVITTAPELFDDRADAEETPVDFTRRVYRDAGHLDGRLMTGHMDMLDKVLSSKLRSVVKYYGSLPADLNIPQKFEKSGKAPPVRERLMAYKQA